MISLLSRHISNDIIAVCANLLYDIMFVRPDRNHGKCICEEGVIIPVCVCVCVVGGIVTLRFKHYNLMKL